MLTRRVNRRSEKSIPQINIHWITLSLLCEDVLSILITLAAADLLPLHLFEIWDIYVKRIRDIEYIWAKILEILQIISATS